MPDIRPWYNTERSMAHTVGGSPFKSLGTDWCPHCKMEVTTDTRAGHKDTVYVYKVQCERCGGTIKHGIYDNVVLITNERPLPPAAFEWCFEPGRDRR